MIKNHSLKMAWIRNIVKCVSEIIKLNSAADESYETILDTAFEGLHRNGFFDQPRAVWENQILNAVRKALPDLNQRPGNDAGTVQDDPAESQRRKRRVAQDDVSTRSSKRMRKPNKKYLDI